MTLKVISAEVPCLTRIHSSRMRTVRSSSHLLGGVPTQGVYLVPGGWGYLPGGVPTQGRGVPVWGEGVPAWGRGVPAQGGYLVPGGVPAWGVYLPGGAPAQGVYLPRRVYLPGGLPAQVLPPVNRMTDRQV